VSVPVTHYDVVSTSFYLLMILLLWVLHDVGCKFLPGSSICLEGTVFGIGLLCNNVHVCDSVHIYERATVHFKM